MAVYMDMTPGTQTFSLNMILTGTTTSRLWNIRISQVLVPFISPSQKKIMKMFCL